MTSSPETANKSPRKSGRLKRYALYAAAPPLAWFAYATQTDKDPFAFLWKLWKKPISPPAEPTTSELMKEVGALGFRTGKGLALGLGVMGIYFAFARKMIQAAGEL